MIVNRTVFLNPVEPHPLSLRVPMGMETKLNLAFRTSVGGVDAPYPSDIAAQLQLTGRTSARTNTYFVPATDIVNGKARAIIPGDALNDPNGYRLRLVGTLNGEPSLLAFGTVMPIAAAGLEAVPDDVIDSIDLTFEYNEPVELDVNVWQDAGKNSEYDLASGSTLITAAVYSAKGGNMLQPFTVDTLDLNSIRLSLTAEQVNTLPPTGWWSLVASGAGGATTLAEGSVTITGVIDPPLTEETFLWEYLVPPTDVGPASGQVVQCGTTMNTLKVYNIDSVLEDRSAILAKVKPGDEIAIGGTTWIVMSVLVQLAWYDFTITPVAQDAATGVVPVTFRRPVPE